MNATDLDATFESFPGGSPSPAALRLLVANADAWAERWRILSETRSSIDVSYFILREDVFGVSFLGHLLKKAREGVAIRLLLDAQGTHISWSFRGNDYLDELLRAGDVKARNFRPLMARLFEAISTLRWTAAVASEHDKIIIADGRRSLIGGRNIGAEYFADPKRDEHVFEDVDVSIEGSEASRALAAAFEAQYGSRHSWRWLGELWNLFPCKDELLAACETMDAWLRGAPAASNAARNGRARRWLEELEPHAELRGVLERPEPPTFDADTRILDSETRFHGEEDPISRGIARLVEAATERIVVASPYLVLSEKAVSLVEEASRRGVEISILTNSPTSSDNALSQAFFLEQWPEILARAPKARIFVSGRRNTFHGKIATFDDRIALVGTYNLDPLSMRINSEVVAVARSAEFARQVLDSPLAKIATGPPEIYEYRIRRDPAGRALRDGEGRPQIEFGPGDHCAPEEWSKVKMYWRTLRAARKLGGASPLF
jgi:phosphatidylserine/phosphatidylglycerophosphate/cardiolipin synthase-like enzyme